MSIFVEKRESLAPSFKALRCEVELANEKGHGFWIVPEYTGTPRRFEVSADHLERIIRTCEVFGVKDIKSITNLANVLQPSGLGIPGGGAKGG